MEKQVEPSESKPARDEHGRLLPGNTANLSGRLPDTEEDRIKKKATKQIVAEYRAKLAEALPLIEPNLVAKAIAGEINAIKEVHDRVMGKPPQDLNLGQNPDMPFRLINVIKKEDDSDRDNS